MLDLEKKKLAAKRYYEKNKEKFRLKYINNREKLLQEKKIYRQNNQEIIIKYRESHKEQQKILEKNWRVKNKDRIKECKKNRYNTNILLIIKNILSSRIRMALRYSGIKKSKHTLELLGCTIPELKEHLEKQFKPGMGWDNRKDWHIDHILPCVRFNLLDIEEQKICFHYLNLQPLWAEDNLQKASKILLSEEEMSKLKNQITEKIRENSKC